MRSSPARPGNRPRHHLVVLREPYLGRMLAGRKRIECRMSMHHKPPFEAVRPGDLLWLKPPSKPVCAVATAGRCAFRSVRGKAEWTRYVAPHRDAIAAEPAFWADRDQVRFVSLIWVTTVLAIEPIPVVKRDRRAWVVMHQPPKPRGRIE